jgi:hypothetical protein
MNKIRRTFNLSIALVLTICTFQSCMLFRGIIVEEDIVYSTKRVRVDFGYAGAREIYSPLINVTQTIIKETNPNSTPYYRSFDRIKLRSNSFRLDNRVFILIDNAAYQVNVESVEFEKVSRIEEKRKDVMTVDSSKVSVVTGYEQNQSNDFRISYTIEAAVIEKIKTANWVCFRYYTGPDMITVPMGKFNLKTLKLVIEKQ